MTRKLPISYLTVPRRCLCDYLPTNPFSALAARSLALQKRQRTHLDRRHGFGTVPRHSYTQEEITSDGVQSRAHRTSTNAPPIDWNTRLDPYLPLELRSKTGLENLVGFKGVRSAETLPIILQDSSRSFPKTLLAHIGLVDGKWDALTWLSKALVLLKEPDLPNPFRVIRQKNPWMHVEDFKPKLVPFIKLRKSMRSSDKTDETLNTLTESTGPSTGPLKLWKFGIGQVWQCLGHVVIEAANRNIQDRSHMMSYVYQLLALMHSQGVVSPLIYQYDTENVLSTMRKPPFLHIMSSRIMAGLSDTMWKVTEPGLMRDAALVAATYTYRGREMPGSELNPRVRPLGPEVWLELILWSCVHGSYFEEAGKLVEHAQGQTGAYRWNTQDWEELQETLNRNWAQGKPKSRMQSWFDRIAGASEGYSEEPPAVTLDERSLSKEVMAAVSNGLATAHTPGVDQLKSLSSTCSYVRSCRQLFGNTMTQTDSLFWDSISDGLLSDADINETGSKERFTRKMQIAEGLEQSRTAIHGYGTSMDTELAASRARPLHAVLLRALDQCVQDKDVTEGIACFDKLRKWSENNLGTLADRNAPDTGEETIPLASLTAYLPNHLLASLLDVMTEAKVYAFVRSLLPLLATSDEASKIQGLPWSTSPLLQSSVLRFANATNDRDLELAVLTQSEQTRSYISDDAIREFLYSQLLAGEWDHARFLLTHMRSDRRLALTAVDIAKFCSVLFQHPYNIPLMRIIYDIFSREYHPQRDFSKPPDYSLPRTLNQIARMGACFRHSRCDFFKSLTIQDGQASNSIMIPAEAFNILLSTIASIFGPTTGYTFFRRWCLVRSQPYKEYHSKGGKFVRSDGRAKVVHPNIRTLRILISPYLRELQKTIRGGMFTVSADAGILGGGGGSGAMSSQEVYNLTYEAFQSLPKGSGLGHNLNRYLSIGKRLGLVSSSYKELMSFPVGKEEVVRIQPLDNSRSSEEEINNDEEDEELYRTYDDAVGDREEGLGDEEELMDEEKGEEGEEGKSKKSGRIRRRQGRRRADRQ